MWTAAGLFALAGLCSALNTLTLIRAEPARRLPLLHRSTVHWTRQSWLTYAGVLLFGLLGLFQAAHRTGYPGALAAELVIVWLPIIVITIVHDRRIRVCRELRVRGWRDLRGCGPRAGEDHA